MTTVSRGAPGFSGEPPTVEIFRSVTAIASRWRTPATEIDILDRSRSTLDPSELRAVMCLANREDIPLRQLAADLAVTPSHASKIVDGLVGRRLVSRRTDRDDRRITRLTLTATGRRTTARLTGAGAAVVSDLIADWPDQDAADLAHLLTRLAAAVGARS